MERINFLAWLITIGGIALFAGIVMVRAYGPGRQAPPFAAAIALVESERTEPPEAIACFQSGYAAFQTQRYSQAVDAFTQALQQSPEFAEAFHNRGRALANLKQQPQAVRSLLQACDAYALNDNPDGLAQVKQDLGRLKGSDA